jgi:hypothetical protein
MFAQETVTHLALVTGSHPALFALITKNLSKGCIESVNFVSEDHFRAMCQKAGGLEAEIASKISDAKQASGLGAQCSWLRWIEDAPRIELR